MLLGAKAVAELINMQAMQPYETPWLEGASTLLAQRHDKAEARAYSLPGGGTLTPCTGALAKWIMLFPLGWCVSSWSETHDSKELIKFVASIVNFFLRVAFSTLICHLTPVLLQKLQSSLLWLANTSEEYGNMYRVPVAFRYTWFSSCLWKKIVTWQIPRVI